MSRWVFGAAVAAVLGAAHSVLNARLIRVPPARPRPCRESVSVLLPARDEADRITPALRSLMAQRGLPDLEILVLDDCSTDDTAGVVRRVGGDDERVRVLVGEPPPAGLPGKPHACAHLVREARGAVVVLVDADVELAPHAVAAAVELLRGNGLVAVSPFPRQLADGLGPRLTQPLLQWLLLVLLPMRLAERSPRPSMSAANGQFLVIDAASLRAAGGYEAIAGAVLDDMAVVRLLKRAGGRTALVDGSTVARCRMYAGWSDLGRGYEKSLWSATGSPWAAAAVVGAFGWVYLVPPVAALFGSRAGLVGYLAGVASRVVTGRKTGARVWPDALAHPVSVAVLLGLVARSWWARLTGGLTWKGRALDGSS
ncbi:glycosyltransferase family 2 protein [Actinokineospora sp. NBRC 105648]|uniref:glycosyltransferase n=1 Tax=Actinokineospora sp. NBRC 105648 TaxID=3032206 RepID=UPI0024A26B56|nr:glycosyltransferase family 2 protein [Actinokineospora sp. NBRC 105648]GLZ40541.1 glycosyl transferase [Actinokineospora sp. NBRC 105648]